MGKHSCGLWITQWVRRVLGLVVRQQPIVQKRIVPSDTQLVEVFQVYATDVVELLAREQGILIISRVQVEHDLVRLYVPVIIVFVFDRCFVKHLSWTNVIFATKTAKI